MSGMTASGAATRGDGSSSSEKTVDRREEIFGSFDGMTSTLGVIAGLLATGASANKILAAAIGIAVAATIGMGAGQYLSDGQRNVRLAVVMGLATLVGSVLPAHPVHLRRLESLHPRVNRDHARSGGSDRPLPRIPRHVFDPRRGLDRHSRPLGSGRLSCFR